LEVYKVGAYSLRGDCTNAGVGGVLTGLRLAVWGLQFSGHHVWSQACILFTRVEAYRLGAYTLGCKFRCMGYTHMVGAYSLGA
jgi:hypothetical protein